MDEIKIVIQNFDVDRLDENFDLVCDEIIGERNSNIIGCSIVELPEFRFKIKFRWKEYLQKLSDFNFTFIAKANTLFFTSVCQWGAIDISNRKLTRHEYADAFPIVEKKRKFCFNP